MDILRAEKLAQDRSRNKDWDKSFILLGSNGALACEWLDPYFGLFEVEGHEGFMMTKQIPWHVIVIMPEEPSASDDEPGSPVVSGAD